MAASAGAAGDPSGEVLDGLNATGPIIPPRQAPAPAALKRPGLARLLLAYLGLPQGTAGPRPPVRVLKLRAGLKIGCALGLGGPRPLGGGVFEGGALTGRRRFRAGMVTLMALTTAGVGWASLRGAPESQQAQAASAGTVAGNPRDIRCAVRYQLRSDSGRSYEARLTVATSEELARSQWRIQFSYPGTQRLTGAPKAVTQNGKKVTAKGSGALQSFTLRGEYRGYNPLPLSFSLDGEKCRTEVLGSAPANRHRREADNVEAIRLNP
jgi:hypothetical protein